MAARYPTLGERLETAASAAKNDSSLACLIREAAREIEYLNGIISEYVDRLGSENTV